MFRVICELPNASHCISGVDFEDHEEHADGHKTVISVEALDADEAAAFKGIPGYSIIDAAADHKPSGAKRGRKSNAEKAAAAAAEAAAAAAANAPAPEKDESPPPGEDAPVADEKPAPDDETESDPPEAAAE